MIALRGAVTVEADTEKDVTEAVSELLEEISVKNKINKDDIICLMFSQTGDIKSFYPAAAARKRGFTCALYSSAEPDVFGGLPLCIRVMALVDIDRTKDDINHVYLKGAAKLRPDLIK